MVGGQGNHWTELADVLRVAGPFLVGAALLAGVIFAVVRRPPTVLHVTVAEWRRQLILVGAGIPLGALAAFVVLYWTV